MKQNNEINEIEKTPKIDLIKNYINKNKKKTIIIGIIICSVLIFSFKGEDKGEISLIKIDKGPVEQMVSVTGTFQAEKKINLQFKGSGKLMKTLIKEGDTVKEGQLIAYLDSSTQAAMLSQRSAQLEQARAKLAQLVAGSKDQEITLQELAVSRAEIELNNARNNLNIQKTINTQKETEAENNTENAKLKLELAEIKLNNQKNSLSNSQSLTSSDISDAFDDAFLSATQLISSTENALTQADNFLGVDNQSFNDSFEINLMGSDSSKYFLAQQKYSLVKTLLNTYNNNLNNDDSKLEETINIGTETESLINSTFDILNNAFISNELNSTTLDGYKTTMSSTRTTYLTTKTSFEDKYQSYKRSKLTNDDTLDSSESTLSILEKEYTIAQNDYNNAILALETLKQNNDKNIKDLQKIFSLKQTLLGTENTMLDLKKADPREVDLKPLKADISRAVASYVEAKANLDKQRLFAPFTGIVTKINYEPGEIVHLNSDFLSIESDLMQIIANVPETDVVKLQLNNEAEITFDAIGPGTIFKGKVYHIDVAETVLDGVIYYEIKVVLNNDKEANIKPGMTANVEIITAFKEDILRIPLRLVKYKNNQTYIEKFDENSDIIKQDIEIGIEGESFAEVLEGLEENEEIISYIKK